MIMDNETILELYRKSQEEGDPVEQIKSLARLNNCTTGEIRKILTDNGEFVPRQKPGPKPKAAVINKTCEECVPKITGVIEKALYAQVEAKPSLNILEPEEAAGPEEAAESEEPTEAAGSQKLPIPDAVKICLMRGLDDLDAEIKRKSEELRILEAQYSTAVKYIETI